MPKSEERIQAFRWKLGLPGAGENTEEMRRIWETMARDATELRLHIDAVSKELSKILQAALKYKLTGEHREANEWVYSFADVFLRWVAENEPARSPKLSGLIGSAVATGQPVVGKSVPPGAQPPPHAVKMPPPVAKVPPPVAKAPPPKGQGLHPAAGATPPPLPPSATQPPPLPPHGVQVGPTPVLRKNPAGPPAKAAAYNPPPPTQAVAPTPAEAPVPEPPAPHPSPGSMWRFKPLPNHPDPHSEADARVFDKPPRGFRMFGARVRGKKHKHDGTNCDDWFHFDQVGPWTIIAVSDGAGSCAYSRVGAKAACETAVRELATDLADHSFVQRYTAQEWQEACQQTEPDLTFAADDVDQVRKALHRAMRQAYDAVAAAFHERAGKPEYEETLKNKRPLELKDLSCTLLLAVHRTIVLDGKELSFVLAVQVGDGITGAIHRDGRAFPIGSADSGGYSGETEFLTSDGKLDANYLGRKTANFIGSMQSLMVMTDGVADDYFPADANLGRLWGDLVVNGIPQLDPVNPATVDAALAATPLPNLGAVSAADYATMTEVVEPDPRTTLSLRSSAEYAEKLGLHIDEVLKNPALLWAGAAANLPLAGESAAERLRLWLDAYQVRGSFDDRTLVVLHREALS